MSVLKKFDEAFSASDGCPPADFVRLDCADYRKIAAEFAAATARAEKAEAEFERLRLRFEGACASNTRNETRAIEAEEELRIARAFIELSKIEGCGMVDGEFRNTRAETEHAARVRAESEARRADEISAAWFQAWKWAVLDKTTRTTEQLLDAILAKRDELLEETNASPKV